MTPPMRTRAVLVALLLSAACQKAEPASPPVAAEPAAAARQAPAAQAAPASTTLGTVSQGPSLTPAQVLADVDGHAGKTVRVAGTVAAVCPMRGCWMDVAGASGESIRIKVRDGQIVFPGSAVGKKVVVEGGVVLIPSDPAADRAACGDHDHGGAEHHDCARPAGASARIDGVGAIISAS
jgi:hypothetical protein